MKNSPQHNRLRIVAIVILFIVSLNALAAGYSFMVEPSGSDLGIRTEYLRQSAPFQDYLVPGIFLFSVIGIGGLFVAIMAIIRQSKYPILVILQGLVLICWIPIQLMMVTSFHVLHLVIATAGMILVVIGWILKKAPTSHAFSGHGYN